MSNKLQLAQMHALGIFLLLNSQQEVHAIIFEIHSLKRNSGIHSMLSQNYCNFYEADLSDFCQGFCADARYSNYV